MAPTINTYQKVVHTSAEYLGPAAERFIRRQITTHLRIKPENLAAKDIAELTNWVKLTFAMLTDNQDLVEAFAKDLNAISLTTKLKPNNKRAA